jgi:hypothetical protein
MPRIPAELRHYLEEPILISEWYPERDCQTLVRVLADSVDPSAVGGNVWEYFGRVGAKRDVGGSQDSVPEAQRTAAAGFYRRFADGVKGDAASAFEHAVRLWVVYHDTGRMAVYRSPQDDCMVVLRLSNFTVLYPEYLDMLTGYTLEYTLLRGVRAEGGVVSSPKGKKDHHEWHFRVPRTPANIASLKALPVDPL